MANTIKGTTLADKLAGTRKADILWGYDGDDSIDGGAGNDTLHGGTGNDTLNGGDGSDWLYGEAGADIFRYAGPAGQQSTASAEDRIADFSRLDSDRIDLGQLQLSGSGAPSALRWGGSQALAWGVWTAAGSTTADQRLLVDTTGDGKADLSIQVLGAAKLAGGLQASDLIGVVSAPVIGAPVVAMADTASVTENAALSSVSGALLANDSGGSGPLSISALSGKGSGGAALYGTMSWTADGRYTYVLNNASPTVDALGTGATLTETFTYTASDGLGGSATSTLAITIIGSNDAPQVGTTLAKQSAVAGNAFSFTLPASSFTDVDSPSLAWKATAADGTALPSWLSFNAATHSFSGTAPVGSAGTLNIAVSASDGQYAATQGFALDITAASTNPGGTGLLQIDANTAGHTRFLADSSPWNTQIASGATYTAIPNITKYSDSHAIALTSWRADWPSVAIYYAEQTDPLVSVRWIADTWSPVANGQWLRTGNSATVEAQIMGQSQDINLYPGNPYSTQSASLVWNSNPSGLPATFDRWSQAPGEVLHIHVPVGAHPTADSDGFTVIVQPDGRALELYSPVVLSDGTWISEMFSFTDALGGMGVGAQDGRRASMVPSYAGVVTDQDIAHGSIDHALALMVPAAMLATSFTGPALAFDARPNYSGTLAMGTHIALPKDLDLASLGLTSDLGKMLASAAQKYGMYVVDRGGDGILVASQNEPSSTALAQYSWGRQVDLDAIFSHSMVVTHDGIW